MARILFHKDNDNLFASNAWGVSAELWQHLKDCPPHIDDDTHLAKFYRGGPALGKLENTMPGSTFEHFQFERHQFGGGEDAIPVIVGWYW